MATTVNYAEIFKAINDDDLKTMFDCHLSYQLTTKIFKNEITEEEVFEILKAYNEYVEKFNEVWIGDVIFMYGDEWVVTCAYTDGSFDLLSRTGDVTRKNVGLYLKEYNVIDTLEKISVEV